MTISITVCQGKKNRVSDLSLTNYFLKTDADPTYKCFDHQNMKRKASSSTVQDKKFQNTLKLASKTNK